jgi:hypothetical protein
LGSFLEKFLGSLAYVKCGQIDSKIWHTFAWFVWHPHGNRWRNWNWSIEMIKAVTFQLGGMAFSIDQK